MWPTKTHKYLEWVWDLCLLLVLGILNLPYIRKYCIIPEHNDFSHTRVYMCLNIDLSLPLFYLFTYENRTRFTHTVFKHPVDQVESQLCALLNLVIGSYIAAAAMHCKATWGPFPRPLAPSLHYTPDSSLLKTLWVQGIPDSQPWPLKFPVMAACHPCIVELWWQGFRFHTITGAPTFTSTQTGSFSSSWNIPHSSLCCLCPCLWSRSRGSACPASILLWNWVTWERPTYSGGWTIFLLWVFSTQLSLPPAATLESWESEIFTSSHSDWRLMELGSS